MSGLALPSPEEPTADPEKPSSRSVKIFMEAPLGFSPKARRKGIITKEADGELLIYDLERDKAHCLNPSAAAIWKLCDGHTTIEEIARQLGVTRTQGAEEDAYQSVETIVWLALSELRRSHLLDEPGHNDLWPQRLMGMPRRDAVRLIGIGIAVPAVLSITAPTARAVSSCLAQCAPCDTDVECCSGTCFNGPVGSCGNIGKACT